VPQRNRTTIYIHPGRIELRLLDDGERLGSEGFVELDEIDVVDASDGKTVKHWSPPKLSSNFPMAIDDTHHVIAVAFRSPARLALFDSVSGKVLRDEGACADADDVFFDLKRERIYESCGAGVIAVFRVNAGKLQPLAQVPTQSGARTSLFVPELDRLFVAVRAGWFGSNASILVFRPIAYQP